MEADQQIVVVSDDAGVRTIRLNRPERLNSITAPVIDQLCAAFEGAAADDGVHVVLLTGTGRAFSSGADLGDMSKTTAGDKDAMPDWALRRFDQLQALCEGFPKPIVAAVNGLAVGFGFTILGYCDFVIAADSARFRTPFSALGLSPEGSSSYIFPMRMGWTTAARALMLGDWLSAGELVACGFAMKAVADPDLMAEASAFAARLAQAPVQSLVATKTLMLHAHRRHLADIRRLETESLTSLVGTPANLAALEAFAQRQAKKAG